MVKNLFQIVYIIPFIVTIEYNKKEAENCAQIMALDYFIGHAFVMTNDLDND